MIYGSLFSGIGGFDLGFDRAGMRCAWQVEYDARARSVLARHWPDVTRFEDVRDVGYRNLQPVDVICGGFPCQDVSVAGNRAGLAGERSGLWGEFRRIIGELAPAWVVIENVPGLLSSNDGRDMGLILWQLAELGYGWAYRVLDAQYYGVAQRRRRVFIVGHFGGRADRAAAVLFEPDSVPWNPAPRRSTRERIAGTLESRTMGGGFPGTDGAASGHVVDVTAEPISFDWQTSGSERTYIHDRPGATRNLSASKTLAVAFGGNNTAGEIDIATAVNAAPTRRYDFESETFVFEPRYARNGRGAPDTIAPPLKAENEQTGKGDGAPVVATFDPVNVTSKANRTRVEAGLPANTLHEAGLSIIGAGVRRLTPVECERLQGFPDGWTDGQADSPRYRQLGNAVAVPVAEWIGQRIMEAIR